MKRGITMTWRYDNQDRMLLQIVKQRGKLTLEEIQNLLRYEEGQRYCGHYVIFLNCSEETIGGNGLFFEAEQKGDAVDLYEVEAESDCPVCGKYLPPFDYCPNCGVNWRDMDNNVEKLLADMRSEAEHAIRSDNPNASRDCRMAWYWSYIGSVDLARQLGMITEKRRQELYQEVRELHELAKAYCVTEAVAGAETPHQEGE